MSWIDDAGRKSRVATLVRQGKTAAQAGKKAEARHYFHTVLQMAPDQPEALLWLAFLAGGGRPSLAYLARLLEVDPTNQRARAAIRWARSRARPEPVAPKPATAVATAPSRRQVWATVLGLLLILASGLVTVAFAQDALSLPLSSPTRAQIIAWAPTSTPLPTLTETSTPAPTATPTPLPTATATATATATPSPTPTDTPTPPPSPTPTDTPTPTPPPTPTAMSTAIPFPPTATSTPQPIVSVGDSSRWIDVDLTHQRLVAYEGETPVRSVLVSTGLPRTPTVTGNFKIYVKYRSAPMSGPGYYLPNVPYVMYFYGSYGLHGTYWHSNFGQPMSHGCINLPTPDAEWLYNWASVGTPVVIHY